MPFAVASAAVRAGYAFSPVQPIAVWGREHSEEERRAQTGRTRACVTLLHQADRFRSL